VFGVNEWGKVVGVNGRTAIISINKTEECDNCKKCRPGRSDDEVIMEARNKAGAQIGDTVEITDQISGIMAQLMVQAGIPITDGIVGGVIGYIFAKLFNQVDRIVLWIVMMGIICMIISVVLTKRFLANNNIIKANKPIVTSITYREG
jgi:hypothetical protein